MPDAITTLTDVFEDPSIRHGGQSDHARPAAVVSWPAVPIEILRAAGLRPVVIRGEDAATPHADRWLEPDVFPNRLHQLVDRALAGHLRHASCVILPRTSDADYKAFLYLRELARRGALPAVPPIRLFDLLQSDAPEVRTYDALRARSLFADLGAREGTQVSEHALRIEITRTNRARSALRRLLALRDGTPRVSGTDVLPLLGAFWRLAPEEYAALADEAAEILERRAPLHGPRLLLAGALVDGSALHAVIESFGAVIVAEPGPYGSDAPGDDVSVDGDPFLALADKYRVDAFGPRVPSARLRQHIERAANQIDAVVFLLPPDDATFGWDYPALRAWLESRRLPHLCLTGDPSLPLTPDERTRVATFVAALSPRVGVARG